MPNTPANKNGNRQTTIEATGCQETNTFTRQATLSWLIFCSWLTQLLTDIRLTRCSSLLAFAVRLADSRPHAEATKQTEVQKTDFGIRAVHRALTRKYEYPTDMIPLDVSCAGAESLTRLPLYWTSNEGVCFLSCWRTHNELLKSKMK